jgi:hypothetical protein
MDREITEDTEEEEVLDDLPNGDDGWEYLEKDNQDDESEERMAGELDTKDSAEEEILSSETAESSSSIQEVKIPEDPEDTESIKKSTDPDEITEDGVSEVGEGTAEVSEWSRTTVLSEERTPPEILSLEKAVAGGASEYEVLEAISEAKPDIRKSDILSFVRGTDEELPGFFSPGDSWGGNSEERFVELGWINEDRKVTAQGASVLAHASDVVRDGDGTQATLVGYLNSEGIDSFFNEALRRGPDDANDNDESGFLDSLLG